MLLIAIDTSGRKGSIALCRGDADSFEVLQLAPLEGGSYSAQLIPQISTALEQHQLDKTELDGFVVVSGPGSFTGLRVGLATVKGLCEVLSKPLATISMLEAIADVYGSADAQVMTILDAGRGEVYVGEYRISSGSAKLVREYIAKLTEFAAEAGHVGLVVTPDAAIAESLQSASVKVKLVASLHADEIGRIGMRKLLAGETVDPAGVDVNYIRRSDAEIFSSPKR